MSRAVTLVSGPWFDLSLEALAQQASDWGYQGIELCCCGEHFEVQRAVSEPDYCQKKLDRLARYELSVPVLNSHRVGQAVGDSIDGRHQALLPDYVWGDGDPEEVPGRAAEEMMATAHAAQKMGAAVVAGFTGSTLWTYACGFPVPTADATAAGFRAFIRKWNPILDVYRDCGVRFAALVGAGQIAFDLYSAEMVLDAFGSREEFGLLLDPSQLHWQGLDPAEFVRQFRDRIYHVHIRDAVLALNGRSGLLCSYLPPGDSRRGWDYRSPGRGGVDWEGLVRALNEVGYEGPLSVAWEDNGMSRDFGAEDACKFVRRLDFEPAGTTPRPTFSDE
jgi:sugar phosphate isomerase/epimerase